MGAPASPAAGSGSPASEPAAVTAAALRKNLLRVALRAIGEPPDLDVHATKAAVDRPAPRPAPQARRRSAASGLTRGTGAAMVNASDRGRAGPARGRGVLRRGPSDMADSFSFG